MTSKLSRPRASAGRIPELDGLRGLAILLVLLDHYIASTRNAELGLWPHRVLSLFTVGWSGVDLFFVLSGFLIGGILLDARESPTYFKAFYLRRVHRILPVYYGWILLFVVSTGLLMWGWPGWSGASVASLKQAPIQLLFLQNMQFGTFPWAWAWFAVTWSLAVEEQFYLVAPPLVRLLSSRKLFSVLVTTICAAPILRLMVARYWLPGTSASSFLMPCRADALAIGILLAMGWRSNSVRQFLCEKAVLVRWTLFGLLGGILGLYWWLLHPSSMPTLVVGFTWLAAFYACLITVALTQESSWVARAARWTVLRRLGTISYCVYIIHYPINLATHRVFLHGTPEIFNWQGVGVTLLSLTLTMVVARVSWRYLENPLIERGHRYSYWPRGASAPLVVTARPEQPAYADVAERRR